MSIELQSTATLHTGHKMPLLGLGTWQLTHDTPGAIQNAIHLGYRMIDTSGDYGTQPGIGKGLRRADIDRSTLYVVTKVEETDNAYTAARKNLAELGLEYADLMLIHRPPKDNVGEDLWQGLMRVQREGLTRDIGVSNYSVGDIEELVAATGEVPVVNQIEWSPFGWSREMLDFCQLNTIHIQAYSPLTRGKQLHNATLAEIAKRHSKTPAQILIRWNLQLGTIPIIKAAQPKHQAENLDVFDFELSDNDMDALGSLNEHYSALGNRLAYM